MLNPERCKHNYLQTLKKKYSASYGTQETHNSKQTNKKINKQKPSELSLSLILGCTIEHGRFSALEKLKKDKKTERERNNEIMPFLLPFSLSVKMYGTTTR